MGCVVLTSLWGCLEVDDAADDEPQAIAFVDPSCTGWGCGSNSAAVDSISFWELNRDKITLNSAGVRLVAFQKETTPLEVKVVGHTLKGGTPTVDLVEDDLIGAKFVLQRGLKFYEVRINSRGTAHYWGSSTPEDVVPTWEILYHPEGSGPELHLCNGDNVATDPFWDQVAMASTDAIIFRGDRYDAIGKNVYLDPSGNWFNIGCAGTAVAKMHLIHHSSASNLSGALSTDLGDRSAMLKAITASYCGGVSRTVNHWPLNFMDEQGLYPFDPANPMVTESIESIWGPAGATCLDTPRQDGVVSGLRDIISGDCGGTLPSCGSLGSWSAGEARVLTANPP